MYMYKIFIIDKNGLEYQPNTEELKELFKPLLKENSKGIYPIVKNPKFPRLNNIFTDYGIMLSENKFDAEQKTIGNKTIKIRYASNLGNATNRQVCNFINYFKLNNKDKSIFSKNIYKTIDISVNSYMFLVLSIAKITSMKNLNFPENIFVNITIVRGFNKSCMADTIIYEIKKDIKELSKLLKSKDILYSGFDKPTANSMEGFEFLTTLDVKKFRRMVKNKKA